MCITCYHDLQLCQEWIGGVGQEDVDISHHALLLIDTWVHPALLVQDNKCAFWKVAA